MLLDNRKFFGLNKILLRFIFMYPKDGDPTRLYKLKSFLFIIPVYASVLAISMGIYESFVSQWDGYDVLIQRIVAIVDFVGFLCLRVTFFSNIEKIRYLLNSIGIFEKFCPVTKMQDAESNSRRVIIIFFIYGIIGNIINSYLPIFYKNVCLTNGRINELLYQRDPCGLLVRCYFPVDMSKDLFWIATLIHHTGAFVLSLIAIILTLTLISIQIHVFAQIRHCRYLLQQFEHAPASKIDEHIENIILYHIEIIRYAEITAEAFEEFALVYLIVPSLTISGLGFTIITVATIADMIRFTLQLLGWLILLFIISYFCQLLIDESLGIFEDIYNCPWYECQFRTQKQIRFMLMRSAKPLMIKAANTHMSLSTFLSVISSSYSYFTLLLNVRYKNSN